MTKEIAKRENVLELMANKYHIGANKLLETLTGTIIKPDKNGRQATDAEVAAFLLVAHNYDLNPFTKEIYAFPDKRAGIIPIVSVDGYTAIANRHPQYDGHDIEYADEIVTMKDAKPCPEWAEIKIYRKDREHPIIVREYLDEVYQGMRGSYPGPWQTHTKRMLRHKVIIQGIRVAFGISGVYDEDEAERIIDVKIAKESQKPVSRKPETLPPQEKKPTVVVETENKEPENPKEGFISSDQIKLLMTRAQYFGWSTDDVDQHVAWEGFQSKKDITKEAFEGILSHFSQKKESDHDAAFSQNQEKIKK